MPSYQTSNFVAHAIARSPEQLKLFSQCTFDLKDDVWIVDCPSNTVLKGVQFNLSTLAEFAIKMPVSELILSLQNKVIDRFPTRLLAPFLRHDQRSNLVLPTLNDERAIAIIRMSDHKGLFCSDSLGQMDKVNPNDYVGEDIAAKYNIPEVFEKYIGDLYQHRFLDNYELDVLDGLGNKKHQVVRVWLTNFRGEECRMVQVLDDRY